LAVSEAVEARDIRSCQLVVLALAGLQSVGAGDAGCVRCCLHLPSCGIEKADVHRETYDPNQCDHREDRKQQDFPGMLMATPLHSTFPLASLSFTYATLFSFALLEQEKDETVSSGFVLLGSKPDGLKPAKARFGIPLRSSPL
jgi:hypothetical protein